MHILKQTEERTRNEWATRQPGPPKQARQGFLLSLRRRSERQRELTLVRNGQTKSDMNEGSMADELGTIAQEAYIYLYPLVTMD